LMDFAYRQASFAENLFTLNTTQLYALKFKSGQLDTLLD